MSAIKTFTREEVARHNTETDCWTIIDERVYDVTKFIRFHPGGKKVLIQEGGKDSTEKFKLFHGSDVMRKYDDRFRVGYIAGSEAAKLAGTTAEDRVNAKVASAGVTKEFGDMVPYGDPAWYQRNHSPYYKETHYKWRAKIRAFVDEHVMPYAHQWDTAKSVPKDLYAKMHAAGIMPAVVGAPWPKEYAVDAPEDFDQFHELILWDEIARCGSGGVIWGMFLGLNVGLPPVLKFGTKEMQRRVAPDCLSGKKFICLAITEPYAGSDVSAIRTTARREGDYFIVNGNKKWITNGIFADYFTVAVRTGGPGSRGISLLLIEKDMPGVGTRRMDCTGMWASGTTYVTFDDVKVPVSNLIGEENQGFKLIMYNFNHERWAMVTMANRFARTCYEEAFKYSMQRETFGKKLIEHQVIRLKVAEMARQLEATHAWLESITYQMTQMPKEESMKVLGGPIALMKAHTTKVFEFCAREAAQIFGGQSYVRGSVAEKVERLYREVRAFAIPGGSEEILLDFGARQAQKLAKVQAKL